jgi:uncharacterized phage-associated protein
MTYDARVIANHMLDYADGRGVALSNLPLNKITYFVHGIYYSTLSRPLIKNSFEAWEYGPVVRVIYDAFKCWGDRPIRSRARRFNPVENAYEEIADRVTPEDSLIVEGVFDMFSPMTAGQLIDLTHADGSPWAALWESDELVVRPGMVIRDDEIVAHVRRYAV